MKFAIYVRVSTTDQILENQINPLVAYAERMGYDYEIFKEKESTRKTRPVQWDLYNRLLKKEFDGLLFYKLDRWARSLNELVMHMEALHEKGIILVSYMENIDLSTSSGKLMMNIMGSFAEFERDIIRERTLAGLARAKAQGKIGGRHPKNCGCGKKGHNGHIKPIRDESNKIIGWNGLEEQNRLKIRARNHAQDNPIKDSCEECGSIKNLERHHPDYNYSSKFNTLCRKCHKKAEKQTPPIQPTDSASLKLNTNKRTLK